LRGGKAVKRSRKLVLVLLVLLIVFTVSFSAVERSLTSTPPSDRPMGEHLNLSIAFWDIATAFRNKDPVLRKIEQDFNLTFEPVQITMSDYHQKLQMWATSDKLPDVFVHSIASDSPGIYNEWIKHGLIKPLPEDLTPYPYVDQIAQIPDIRLLRKDNRLYMLPRIGYPTNRLWMLERVVFVRKDWMNDALIREVAGFEDFSNMLATFTNRRVSSGSEQPPVGLTAAGMNGLAWAFSSTFPQFAAGQWVFEDNVWIPYYASRKMDEVVVQLRKLYENGALDPDFYYMKEEDALTKFAQGQAGALVYRATPSSLSTLEELWKDYQPNKAFHDSVDILRMWLSEEGYRYYYVAQTYWSETFFNANISDEKMSRVLKLYDYLLSPEGQRLTSYGLEGVDYRLEDGNPVMIRPIDERNGQPDAISSVYPSIPIFRSLASWGKETEFRLNELNKISYGEANIQKSLSEMEWLINNAVATPAYHKINSLSTPAKDKLSAMINPLEDLIKVVISREDPVAMWHDHVRQYRELGLGEAIQEVNLALSVRDNN